jgi:hypothetical protein
LADEPTTRSGEPAIIAWVTGFRVDRDVGEVVVTVEEQPVTGLL